VEKFWYALMVVSELGHTVVRYSDKKHVFQRQKGGGRATIRVLKIVMDKDYTLQVEKMGLIILDRKWRPV
jgi:hypothetical protein